MLSSIPEIWDQVSDGGRHDHDNCVGHMPNLRSTVKRFAPMDNAAKGMRLPGSQMLKPA